MPADDEMVVLNCRVPAKLVMALDAVAESEDRSRASVVRRALERAMAAVTERRVQRDQAIAQAGGAIDANGKGLLESTEKTQEQLDQEYADRMAER